MSQLFGEVPTNNKYFVALPALQLNVTVEEPRIDPGTGLSICAGPDAVGEGVGLGVTVGVGFGVEVGEGVGVGVAVGCGVEVGVGVGVGEVEVNVVAAAIFE